MAEKSAYEGIDQIVEYGGASMEQAGSILMPGKWGQWIVARTPHLCPMGLGWMAFLAFPPSE